MNRPPEGGVPEASPLLALARYLSDEIAPMLVAESAEEVLHAPQEVLRMVRTWVASQLASGGGRRTSDYVFHAVKKLHLLAELELVDRPAMAALLRTVVPQLIQDCPSAEQSRLVESVGRIGQEEAVLSAPPQFLHRPSSATGEAEDRGGHTPAASEPRPVGGAAAGDTADTLSRGLSRLNVLLDRFEAMESAETARVASAAPAAGGAAPAAATDPIGPARQALLAEIVARVAGEASSAATFASQLDLLGGLGLPTSQEALVRQLGRALPNWAAPPDVGDDVTRSSTPLRAIRSVVSLARGSDQALERFGELVGVAVEEFNSGHLGRSATLFELASKMVADGEVDSAVVRSVTGEGFTALDQERLRTDAEHDDRHPMLRRVVAFFPQLAAEELLLQLEVESKRDRRRFLIEMLRVHGRPSRALALKALRDSVSGDRPLSWYVERNMIHVLRRIPRADDELLDREIEALVRCAELEGPLPLVREALAALGAIHHPAVDRVLVARVGEAEKALLGQRELPHDADELRGLLDRLVSSLAARSSSDARRCVVEHGLRRKGALGDTTERLAALGRHDLSDQPTIVGRILEALQGELPVQVLGVTVASKKRGTVLRNLLDALAGTGSGEVRDALRVVATGYEGQTFAARAQEILERLEAGTPPIETADDGPSASMSGDLELFGLPNLLQNLSDNRLTGELELLAGDGRTVATVRFRSGGLVAANAGSLRGETALFQLLERPFPGRFEFTRRALERGEVEHDPMPVVPLLLEGMRRYDELTRATAVVPDDARLRTIAAEAPAVDDEPDRSLVAAVWAAARAGRTATECERVGEVDAYRVRRLLEAWLAEGALAVADPDDPPS